MNENFDLSSKTAAHIGMTALLWIALVFFVLSSAALGYLRSYKPPELHYGGTKEIQVVKLDESVITTYHRGRPYTTHYYTCNTMVLETGEKHNQTLNREEYDQLTEGKVYTKPVFTTDDGHFYVSWSGEKSSIAMTKEYYRRFPDAEIISRRIVFIIPFAAMMICLSFSAACYRADKKSRKRTSELQRVVSYEDILRMEREKEED